MLQKQPLSINFAQGLNQKVDPYQLPAGKFQSLSNVVFDTVGQMKKRNGYSLMNSNYLSPTWGSGSLTTLGGNLVNLNSNLYSNFFTTFEQKGVLPNYSISTNTVSRSINNKIWYDSAVSATDEQCCVYMENASSPTYWFTIVSLDNSVILTPQRLDPTAAIVSVPRVIYNTFTNNFAIFYITHNTGSGAYNITYLPFSTNPVFPFGANGIVIKTDVSIVSNTVYFDCASNGNYYYFCYNATGTKVNVASVNATTNAVSASTSITSSQVTSSGYGLPWITMAIDNYVPASPVIAVSWAGTNSSISATWLVTLNTSLSIVSGPTNTSSILSNGTAGQGTYQYTSYFNNGVVTYLNTYVATYQPITGFNSFGANSAYYAQWTVGTGALDYGNVNAVQVVSRPFLYNSTICFFGVYTSTYQSTYFMMDISGRIYTKFAYGNGPTNTQLTQISQYIPSVSSVTVNGSVVYFFYYYQFQLETLNKTGTFTPVTSGFFSQYGINQIQISPNNNQYSTVEIAGALTISGGFTSLYDGQYASESGFNLWPEFGSGVDSNGTSLYIDPVIMSGTGNTTSYSYIAVYKWVDNKGNIHQSAPSIPIHLAAASIPGSFHGAQIVVPTLQLTEKIGNPVQIDIYRWSTTQQVYYRVTNDSTPFLNNPATPYVVFTDSLINDNQIVGNPILYTTGGVLENIAPPSSNIAALYDSRVFLVDAEDTSLLWFSKQVIEETPVEFTDLQTIFVSPTSGINNAAGPITGLASMDDKLIIFKENMILYITGSGPDATGANNGYSQTTFISSTVGCNNFLSIVLMPNGIIFQSDKGLWLLQRDLNLQYVGFPVQTYTTGAKVLSASNVPNTNQVRFVLDSGVTLMYDFFVNEWGTFSINAFSSTIWQGQHTWIASNGYVYKESPGSYLDYQTPVTMSFTTSWFNLAGLQGYQRAYYFYLLGTYISPHTLTLNISYDYSTSVNQTTVITPFNYNNSSTLEQYKVHLQRQTCQSLQISLTESYDNSYYPTPLTAGAGLTLSGLSIALGLKKGWRPIGQLQSVS